MRVTRAIREYVENEIYKKYEAKIQDIRKDYEAERELVQEHVDQIKDEAEKKAIEYLDSVGYTAGRYGKTDHIFSSCYVRNEEVDNELDRQSRIIRHDKDEKIKQVLFDLEMGDTDKAKLKEVLDSIIVD